MGVRVAAHVRSSICGELPCLDWPTDPNTHTPFTKNKKKQREKAAPLWEDPKLMTAEALNEIFAPDEKVGVGVKESVDFDICCCA